MKLETLSAKALGELVKKQEVSPTEVIDYFADHIANGNKTLNAFTYTKIDDAMNEARILEDKLLAGDEIGPFAGVPVGLKDFLPSKKGWTNSHGGVPALTQVDDGDSMFYTAARDLGAIAIGKTNAPPFGFKGTCDNKQYGPTRNPFNLDYNSGGSSGGSASAVGGLLVPMCEGGDAGGSIRIPAAWCNCFGFKPSIGTVPSVCRPDAWSATHPYCFNGAITRTVEDSAMMLNSMARYDRRDPLSLPINSQKDFVKLMKKPIDKMRIGFTYGFNMFPIHSEVRRSIDDSVKLLQNAGIEVDEVHFDFKHSLDDMARCWCWAISVDTAYDLATWKKDGLDLIADHSQYLTPEFIYWNKYAHNATIFDMKQFNDIRTDILDQFETAFESYDLIISPVTCCPPLSNENNGRSERDYGLGLNFDLDFIEFGQTFLVNFVGYPAASIPVGLTSNGLPLGLHAIGPKYQDEDVFAISSFFEQMRPWDKYYTNRGGKS